MPNLMPSQARKPCSSNQASHQSSYQHHKNEPLTLGDLLEGTAQLATTGMVEMTELVEAIHKEIVLRPFASIATTTVDKLHDVTTGRIYHVIKNIMRFSGGGVARTLRLINNQLQADQQRKQLPEQLKMLVNIINGVMGDHLVMQDNPLAVPMLFYDRYGSVHKTTQLSGKVVIMVHGLCMSYHGWHPGEDISLGEHIVYAQPETTILYLDYNTGRRISENGHSLSNLLETLVENNPHITDISLIGHSMGGLVSRSAIFYGKQESKKWLKRVDNYIALGSPHHGAILERISFFMQESLAKVPIAGNLSHLLDLRSAGIIDLRHGSIRDDDWQTLEKRMGMLDDLRRPAPLPSSVNAFLVAASLETMPKKHQRDFVGDGLVSVTSALGEHAGEHDLKVPEAHKAIFYGVNHMDIQHHERVRNQIITWLNMPQSAKNKRGNRIISVSPAAALAHQNSLKNNTRNNDKNSKTENTTNTQSTAETMPKAG